VVHRHHLYLGTFQRAETTLDHHQTLVTARRILETNGIVVGFNYPFSIILCRLTNGSPVNTNEATFGGSQIFLETA
jgi:hypothetical protein